MNEDKINDMGFPFFEDVLTELNYKLTYDAVANYAGNSFFEKSWDLIAEHHPLYLDSHTTQNKAEPPSALQGLAQLFGG